MDYDTAYEEMIADSMEGILSDGKVLEKLKGLQESDPTLWEKVKQWAKDIAEKIRAVVDAYKGERMDSTEGQIVANMKEILPQLEELYAEGLADTAGKGDTGAKNAANDGGVNFSIRNTSNMDWKTQIISALKHNGIVRHMDTLVVMKETPDFCLKDGVDNLPMAIPLSVITKAQKGKNADHSISDKNLISLKSGMENAIAVIDNPGRNSFAFITPLYENGGKIVAFFEKNVLFDGDMVHKATSIHSRTDVGGLLNNISDDAVIYVKNKNEFDNLVGMSDSISDAYKNKVKFVYDSLPHKKSAVKEKLSDRDISYTPEDIQRMEDELSDVSVRLSDAERRYNSLLNNEDLMSAEKRMKEIRDNSTSLREAIRSPEYKAARAERDAIKERPNIEAEKEAYFDISYQEKGLRRNLDSARESVKADEARRKEAEAA